MLSSKQRIIARLLLSIIICFGIYYGFLFTYHYLMPFVFVILLSSLLQKPITIIMRMTQLNRLWASLLSIVGSLLCAGILLRQVGFFILSQLHQLVEISPQSINQTFKVTFQHIKSLTSRLEQGLNVSLDKLQLTHYFSDDITQNISNTIQNGIKDIFSTLFLTLADGIISILQLTSTTLIVIILTFLLCKDWHFVMRSINKPSLSPLIQTIESLVLPFKQTLFAYIKTQCLISCVTTCILLVGFLFITAEYAFVLAIILGFFDWIPFIGVGILIWPWIVYAALSGHYQVVIILACMYTTVLLSHHILEPHLMAKSMNLKPLFLISIGFFSYRLFDVWGILLTPLFIILIQTIRLSQIDKQIVNYVKYGYNPKN
ncbi:sporulation integral membrane protein YtvI [Pelagirhabdus alkalitolerans]|uniref:Sporulation integral membrane protein YtvI n=1 Tax=Pelagirhabdus alkalitolerans TaxID=1612202 RepID=A0A1G6HK77_9BACI|nr:AI-2E family transporter [Pelagirhabdus alkalitolerans]SDB94601.1 sporulation integral membrane protein YtvI [Pelagirhabdus alkalitolerans]